MRDQVAASSASIFFRLPGGELNEGREIVVRAERNDLWLDLRDVRDDTGRAIKRGQTIQGAAIFDLTFPEFPQDAQKGRAGLQDASDWFDEENSLAAVLAYEHLVKIDLAPSEFELTDGSVVTVEYLIVNVESAAYQQYVQRMVERRSSEG